jgi:hypothetical protein
MRFRSEWECVIDEGRVHEIRVGLANCAPDLARTRGLLVNH